MVTLGITLLLIIANGSPVLVSLVLGPRAGWPIDAGRHLADGKRIFGASKTWRGLASSLLLTGLSGWLLGFGWYPGFTVAAGAMAGDLSSSFIKRRMGMASSARAIGLDHLPEALIPGFLLAVLFGYSWAAVLIAAGLFVLTDVALSPLLFRWGLRRVPH